MKLEVVRLEKPEAVNVIVGQSHFIKTVEDLYEALVQSMPGIQFGLAFCESSGPCLVRSDGTDAEMRKLAAANALAVGAGHSFFVLLKNAFPVNVLNAVKAVPEVCRVFCATANPVEIVVAETEHGRGILGVVDGQRPKGVETEKDVLERRELLRKIGYKR